MKKAIVTGASGFIASGVVEYLLEKNIEVLALGRRSIDDSRIRHLSNHPQLTYHSIDLSELEKLPQGLEKIGWSPGEACVFYHFAWAGKRRLADGSVHDQFNNVTYAANAVVVASQLGCIKFINAGSQEERFVDRYLEEHWTDQKYHSSMGVYASAKVAARDMCLLIAYLQKMEYVHTRISIILEETMETSNYINHVLQKMIERQPVDPPMNQQLFDFLSKEDCARAYYFLGKKGKNKSDYFLGSGSPKTLHAFLQECARKITGKDIEGWEMPSGDQFILQPDDFDIQEFIDDTGFTPSSAPINFKGL